MATVSNFYIGSVSTQNKISIEISPQLARTLDESLDNLNVTSIANENPDPYLPQTKFLMCDENDNTLQTFIVSADNVELATNNPLRYKHHLSLVQWSEFLTKHETRNTVFSNSYESANQILNVGGAFYYDVETKKIITRLNGATIDLGKRKVKSLVISANFLAFFQTFYDLFPDTTGGRNNILYRYQVTETISINKWSDLYTNNPNNIIYPKIIFTIGNETREWQLGNIKKGQKLIIPDNIINWIKTFNAGILNIDIDIFSSSYGFVLEPYSDVNCPVYGKLVFDIEMLSIETSVYDAIDTLLKQQMKETDDYNSSNDSTIKPLFLLPTEQHKADLYNLLKDTNTPNFTFTQCSFYDALAEIFKLFDATFKIDDDGYLDIEYFNEQAQTPIDKPQVAGENRSLSEERFTNKLITYFQNTKIEHKFPNSNDVNATAYIRSKTLGVPAQSDFCFIVPKPIDIIKKVRLNVNVSINHFSYKLDDSMLLPFYSAAYERIIFYGTTFNESVDITPLVYESNLWSILPTTGSMSPFDKPCKENTLTYERGSKVIDIGRYYNITNDSGLLNRQQAVIDNVYRYALSKMVGFDDVQTSSEYSGWYYTQTTDFKNVKMAVEYIALTDGKLVNESLDNKYNGETLINQSNGSIDINKLGLNMVGLNLKLGQPTLNMTQIISKWDDRVKKGQYFIDGNGDRWVANSCVYTIIKPDQIQTNIEFVKNFNGLAKRIELNNEKRLSNISNELTVKCEETYGEYIYYSSSAFNDEEEKIVFDNAYLLNAVCMGIGKTFTSQNVVEYALITAYNWSGIKISNDELGNVEGITIPLTVYGSGNSVCFEMSFDSPISAGNQLLDDYTSSLWPDGWFSRAVLYSDVDGVAESFDISFVKMNDALTRYYPEMKSDSNTLLSFETYGKINKFKYYKKPNEIFALNYQLHFMPKNKNIDFLSNEYIVNNGFKNGLNNINFYIVTSTEENIYSILDIKGEGTRRDITNITGSVKQLTPGLNMRLDYHSNISAEEYNNIKSWAIVDEYNNIYFATNSAPKDTNVGVGIFSIYFITRHHRLS